MSNFSPTAVEMAKIGVRRRSSQKTNVTAIEIPGAEIEAAESTPWIRIKTWLEEAKECFNWGDFFFALIFGLAPTAWDMYTRVCHFGVIFPNHSASGRDLSASH